MQTLKKNQAKKICCLYYQDKIWQLRDEGKSIREITQIINRRYIPRSRFKGITISKSTVHTIIKKKENNEL